MARQKSGYEAVTELKQAKRPSGRFLSSFYVQNALFAKKNFVKVLKNIMRGDIISVTRCGKRFFMKDNAKLITVAGKGGVGKTSVAAAMVKIISQTFPE